MRRSPPHDAARAAEGALCSTPEGIDAAITRAGREACRRFSLVLNARRHRCGDHIRMIAPHVQLIEVLNARRHRCGDHLPDAALGDVIGVCSTPEGIDAAIT